MAGVPDVIGTLRIPAVSRAFYFMATRCERTALSDDRPLASDHAELAALKLQPFAPGADHIGRFFAGPGQVSAERRRPGIDRIEPTERQP